MTPRGRPLSDDGKAIVLCILIPILWPVLPVLVIISIIEKIRDKYYDWKYRDDRHPPSLD